MTDKTSWNKEYAKGFIYGVHPSTTAIRTAQLLIERGLTGKNTHLLEIGGGYGRNSKYFCEQLEVKSTLVDLSETAISLGQRFTHDNKEYPVFLLGDAKRLSDYVDRLYDVVFQNFCLHLFHKDDRKLIYEEISSVLKKGGLFIGSFLSVKDPDCPAAYSKKGITLTVRGKEQHFFTEQEIRDELSPFFENIKIIESSDPEKIIHDVRNTFYYFVVGERR